MDNEDYTVGTELEPSAEWISAFYAFIQLSILMSRAASQSAREVSSTRISVTCKSLRVAAVNTMMARSQ